MRTVARVDPWWAALTVWGVVNAVNVLQAAGFALVAFVRSGAGRLHRGCIPALTPAVTGRQAQADPESVQRACDTSSTHGCATVSLDTGTG